MTQLKVIDGQIKILDKVFESEIRLPMGVVQEMCDPAVAVDLALTQQGAAAREAVPPHDSPVPPALTQPPLGEEA